MPLSSTCTASAGMPWESVKHAFRDADFCGCHTATLIKSLALSPTHAKRCRAGQGQANNSNIHDIVGVEVTRARS